jgi:hypothetical protein
MVTTYCEGFPGSGCDTETDVVDGAGGSVVVEVVERVVAGAGAAVVGESDDGFELEHAAPNPIDAATSATTIDRRLLVSGCSRV